MKLIQNLFLILIVGLHSMNVNSQIVEANGSSPIGSEFVIDYQNPKQYEIGPIKIEGADNFDHNSIKLIAGLRTGDRIMIPGEKFSKAIKNLWKEELFSDAEILIDKEINGIVYLTIKLAPRPKLSRYKFKGVNKREADKVREEISLYTGKTITENLVFVTENKIKGYFRDKGYYSVNVHISRQKDTLINNSEIFTIDIQIK